MGIDAENEAKGQTAFAFAKLERLDEEHKGKENLQF